MIRCAIAKRVEVIIIKKLIEKYCKVYFFFLPFFFFKKYLT